MLLEAGSKAPAFTLPDQDGRPVSLGDFPGKKIILYFYPKDNTSGCTRQAQAFAALNGQFEAKNAVVIGVSKDSVASHRKFAEKYELPFTLLSEEKKNYGKVTMGVVRSTYVIDENGIILKANAKVKPDTNAAELLAWLG